jgi:Holliday junction resolvase RusA-like endonuclease|tara:strand:- start:13 stop:372 length:360 start_codon:yes stop_codon:yes gene_type:complete
MILPFPPTLNGLYAGKTRRYKSTRYKKWIAEAQIMSCKQKLPVWVNGFLKVQLDFVRPDKRKRDLDNLAKAVLDFCTDAQIWKDDCQVEHLTLQWVDEDFVGVRITIQPLKKGEPKPSQ